MPEGATILVNLHSTALAELSSDGSGRVRIAWRPEAVDRWGVNAPVLSHALPIGETEPDRVEAFFGGLLPEGRGLARLAAYAHVRRDDVVGLIRHVGADLAGAVTLHDAEEEGADVAPDDDRVIEHEELASLLGDASGYLQYGGGGSANTGVQPKLTLRRGDDGWHAASAMRPSTHILKPVDEQQRRGLEAEAWLLELGHRLGLVTYDSWIEQLGDRVVLIIERYDRRVQRDCVEAPVARLHQEDAAQALGLPWGGDAKYEWADARSSLRSVASLLDVGGVLSRPTTDRRRLLAYTAFNVAIGNTDAHAKNLSLLADVDGVWRLAPLYDVTPQALLREDAGGLAMYVSGRSRLAETSMADLITEGVSWGLSAEEASETVQQTLERLVVASSEIPAPESVADHLPGYVRRVASGLLGGDTAWLRGVNHPMFWARID